MQALTEAFLTGVTRLKFHFCVCARASVCAREFYKRVWEIPFVRKFPLLYIFFALANIFFVVSFFLMNAHLTEG